MRHELIRCTFLIVILSLLPSIVPANQPVVIPAQEKPAGIKERLENGIVVGGRPSMPAQQRITNPTNFEVTTVVDDLRVPWALEFGPSGKLYFTERPGSVKVHDTKTGKTRELFDAHETLQWGEGGLMGLALHPDFPSTSVIYLSQTYGTMFSPANRILRVTIGETNVTTDVLIDDIPAASYHNGSRLAFGPDGHLYATTGDAGEPQLAQDRQSWAGKILRMTENGKPAPDNPFDGPRATPYVYSYGHRNPQGLAWHPKSKKLYASEHGPSGEFGLSGNDEVNRIVRGGNYGWPEVVGAPGVDPYRNPVLHFPNPHLPPAGMTFYRGNKTQFSGDLFMASLYGSLLLRVGFDDEQRPKRIHRLFEEDFFEGRYGRLRAVAMGPEGSLFVSTSNRDGRGNPAENDDRILKLTPR